MSHSHHGPHHCRCHKKKVKPANTDTKSILRDVDQRGQFPLGAGSSVPPDPNAAIGPNQIVVVHNSDALILDKRTGQQINKYTEPQFWKSFFVTQDNGIADPIILYDQYSERFFGLVWVNEGFGADSRVIINAPPEIAGEFVAGSSGNYVAGPNGPDFNLTGNAALAQPPGAEVPLTNPEEIAGKIALIATNNFLVGSATKVNNAFEAGAIGAILYDTENLNSLAVAIAGISEIPSVVTPGQVGLDMIDQLNQGNDVNVTITNEGIVVGENGFSRMFLVVSKNDSPTSVDDFRHYIVGGPRPEDVYYQKFADYPKLGFDEDAIYITTNDFAITPGAEDVTQIVAIPKAGLLDGSLPQNPFQIPADVTLLDRQVPFDQSDSIPVPSMLRPSKTQRRQVTFFAHPITDEDGAGSQINIVSVSDILGEPVVREFLIDVKPWDGDRLTVAGRTAVPQPEIVIEPFGGDVFVPTLLTFPARMIYVGILNNDSLWYTQHVGEKGKLEVRWYEFDVSQIFDASNPIVTLRQMGTIRPEGSTSAFYPTIDIDIDGNMGIGLCLSGPEKYLTLAHTGRLCDDKLGSVRYPLQEVLEADAPYIAQTFTFEPPNLLGSRFNDYTSNIIDPSDGKTFWFYSEYVNDNVETISQDFIRRGWFTALHNYCITEGEGKVKTCPKRGRRSVEKVPRPSVPDNQNLSVEEVEKLVKDCNRKTFLAERKAGLYNKRARKFLF